MKHFTVVEDEFRIVQKCKHCNYVSPTVTNKKPNQPSHGLILHLKKTHGLYIEGN